MSKYRARAGAPFKNKQAQIYGNRIETITKNNKGNVKPIDLVKDGKLKSSPFNDYFEWDNSIAGNKYRLQQARTVLNHIVEVVTIDGKREEHRSFFAVNMGTTEVQYVKINKALSTKSYRLEILQRTITSLNNATTLLKLFKSYEGK